MTALILIKHSLPEIDRSLPARDWRLSAEGRQRCIWLSKVIKSYQPTTLISSTEKKAEETAGITADLLGLPWTTALDLHEHQRISTGWLGKDEFESQVKEFFTHPDKLVMGEETADQAYLRFNQAVENLLAVYPDQTIAVVAHGTVISLLASRHNKLEPFALWSSLGLPSVLVLERPGLNLIDLQNIAA